MHTALIVYLIVAAILFFGGLVWRLEARTKEEEYKASLLVVGAFAWHLALVAVILYGIYLSFKTLTKKFVVK